MSESGLVLENFGLHLGPIRTGFTKIFKTASAGVRTRFWEFGAGQVPTRTKKNDGNFFLYIY